MSALQIYVKNIDREEWDIFEDFVRRINGMAGNDTVRIILGDEHIILYIKPDEKVPSNLKATFTKYGYDQHIFSTIMDKVEEIFVNARVHWEDAFLDEALNLEKEGALPASWIRGADRFGVSVGPDDDVKYYVYSYDGWTAFINDTSVAMLEYYGRRVKGALGSTKH